MKKQILILLLLTLFTQSCNSNTEKEKSTPTKTPHPNWVSFSSTIFDQAKNESKFILLNLHANWCHWCHVMDDSTYSNPAVVRYLEQNYITASADHDLRTDLAERYRAYGWPATIVFDADGNEIVKRAGYIKPKAFLRLLKAIVKDPSPEEYNDQSSVTRKLSRNELSKKLDQDLRSITDAETGGFNTYQRSIHKNTFIYALQNASDPYWKKWVQNTAINSKGLLDTVWGGVYQYSTKKGWDYPHFEKLLAVQARYIELFSYYAGQFSDSSFIERIYQTNSYLNRFLKNEDGLYYNAQDADVIKGKHSQNYFSQSNTERLSKGIPAIDSNTYTKENAQLAIAFLSAYGVTQDETFLQQAKQIHTLLSKRRINHLYQRSSKIDILPIGDQTAMALLNIKLYEISGLQKYINQAEQTINAIKKIYQSKTSSSYKSFIGETALPAQSIPRENYDLAIVLKKISLYQPGYKDDFTALVSWLYQPTIRSDFNDEAGLLLLENMKNSEPVKVEVFGKNHSSKTSLVIAPIHSWPSQNCKVVFADQEATSQKNPLGNQFSLLICNSSFCSSPITTFENAYQYWHQSLTFVR